MTRAAPMFALLLLVPPRGSGRDLPRQPDPPELVLVAVVPATPALSAAIPLVVTRAPRGRGHLDLSADPSVDEVRVHVLLGAAAASPRWQGCHDLTIFIDGSAQVARLRPAAVSMPGGVYDAVTTDLTILDVRAMARARSVRIELCGEELRLPGDASARLREFVKRFYRLGELQGPAQRAPRPLVIPFDDDAPDSARPPTPA